MGGCGFVQTISLIEPTGPTSGCRADLRLQRVTRSGAANAFTYGSDAENRLTSASGPGVTATYATGTAIRGEIDDYGDAFPAKNP